MKMKKMALLLCAAVLAAGICCVPAYAASGDVAGAIEGTWTTASAQIKEVSVMGYVMTPGHEYGIPSDGYADVIWEGYEQCGLDTKPLEDAINKACAMAFQQEQGLAEPGYQGLYGSGGMKPME